MPDLIASSNLEFTIKQRWYHVDISFVGKTDNVSSYLLYHWRDVYDLEIACDKSLKSGVLVWELTDTCKINIYARNLSNNEILYILNNDYENVKTKNENNDAKKDEIKRVKLKLYLQELDKLPFSDSNDDSKIHRYVRLEFNYIISNQSNDSNQNLNVKNVHLFNPTRIHLTRTDSNKDSEFKIYPEFRIILPQGWRINQSYSKLEKKNNKLIECYSKRADFENPINNKLNEIIKNDEINDEDLKYVKNNRIKKIKSKELKDYLIQNPKIAKELKDDLKKLFKTFKKIDSLKTPHFLFKDDSKYLPVACSSIKSLTEIHSPKMEYSLGLAKVDTADNYETKKSYTLNLTIKPKKSLLFTEIFPYVFAFMSFALCYFIFISTSNIVNDIVPAVAMCIAYLNLGVFAYFTYNKLMSIGYAFKNNRNIRFCFGLGFLITILAIVAIIVIVVLHSCFNWFNMRI